MDYEKYDEMLKTSRNRRSEHRAAGAVSKKKKDIITPVLIVQSLICILLLAGCLTVRWIGSGFYEKSRLKYANMLTDKTIETQLTENVLKLADRVPAVRQVMDQLDGYMEDLAAILHIDTYQSKSAKSGAAVYPSVEKDGTADWTLPDEISFYPDFPYLSGINPNGIVSITSVTVRETAPDVSAFGGQGGMIAVADPKNQDILMPPDTATLAPVYLSAKPDLPVDGTITSLYGYRMHPTTGKLDFHNAVDLAAPSGTPIAAVLPGKVEKVVENDEIYGNYVVIKHSDNLSTKYAHCETVLVKEGIVLRQGEIIAKVGSTGVSTGPHCHYEILVDGINVDPNWVYHFERQEDSKASG